MHQSRPIEVRIKVPPDSRFTGFDAYLKLVKSEVDLVMLTTPPGYRPIHFEAAVEAGKHVFAEKPIATDATRARRFMAAGCQAAEKELPVMSGAQRHADTAYLEMGVGPAVLGMPPIDKAILARSCARG